MWKQFVSRTLLDANTIIDDEIAKTLKGVLPESHQHFAIKKSNLIIKNNWHFGGKSLANKTVMTQEIQINRFQINLEILKTYQLVPRLYVTVTFCQVLF